MPHSRRCPQPIHDGSWHKSNLKCARLGKLGGCWCAWILFGRINTCATVDKHTAYLDENYTVRDALLISWPCIIVTTIMNNFAPQRSASKAHTKPQGCHENEKYSQFDPKIISLEVWACHIFASPWKKWLFPIMTLDKESTLFAKYSYLVLPE